MDDEGHARGELAMAIQRVVDLMAPDGEQHHVTAFVVMAASVDLEADESDVWLMDSAPTSRGLPSWQQRGLLLEGVALLDDPEVRDLEE